MSPDLPGDLALAAWRKEEQRRIRIDACRKAGRVRSPAKTSASRRNAKLDTRTTAERSRDGKRSRLTDEQYRINAFRAWANRRDKKP